MSLFTIVNRYEILEKLLDQPNKITDNEKSIKYDSKRKREDISSDYQPNKLRRQSDQSSYLLNHKDKPYQCEICQKSFTQSGDLVKHKRIHTGEKPFECEICHKSFNQSSSLKRHRRTHTGEKPFVCDICPKSFTSSTYLLIHKRIHSGERPFECEFCYKNFSQSSNLLKHKRTHHGQ